MIDQGKPTHLLALDRKVDGPEIPQVDIDKDQYAVVDLRVIPLDVAGAALDEIRRRIAEQLGLGGR
jgi:hypothetical protein